MLDKKEFNAIRADLGKFDKKRESVIRISRDIIKISKQIIYALHRDDVNKAGSLISVIKKKVTELPKDSYDANIQNVAIQEYVEALLYYHAVKDKKLPTHVQLKVRSNHYLLGLCDLTGEIVRKAVYLAGKDKFDEVVKFKDLVDTIYGELLKFDFREPELRRKFDSVKYDLKKLEDLVLDLKLKGKL